MKLFKQDLIDLGYSLYNKVLNAVDYGIPQTRRRYFLIAILDNNKKFKFIDGNGCNKALIDYLEKKVDEKYYLTDDNDETFDKNNILFHNKNNLNKTYEVNIDKYKNGGVCGIDKECKFAQSSRIFSQNGYAPTLTANNTADNCKIVVEGD